MSQLIFLSGTAKIGGVVGSVIVSGSIPSASDIAAAVLAKLPPGTDLTPVLTAISAAQAELDARIAAITVIPPPPPPPGPPWAGNPLATMIAALVPDASGNAVMNVPAGNYPPFGTIRIDANNNPLNDIKTLTINGVPPSKDASGNFISGSGTCIDGALGALKEKKAGILGMTANLIINSVEVKNCGGTSDDGSAGIRNEASVNYFPGEILLTINNSWIHHNQNGILVANNPPAPGNSDAFPGNVVLNGNLIEDNGLADNGLSHGAYIQGYDLKTSTNLFRNNGNGWDLKIRCRTATLSGDTINSGLLSGGLDLPDGCAGTATNITITLPVNASGGNMIGWGEEPYFTNPGDFTFVSGTIDAQRASGSFIYTGSAAGGVGRLIFKAAVQFPHGQPTLSGTNTAAVLFNQ